MIETLIFLIIQLTINLLVKGFNHARATYIFTSLSYLIFIIGLMLYPYFSWRLTDSMSPTDPTKEWRCGNAQIGVVMFQYFIGGPLVIWLQYLFNKVVHKPGMKIKS